MTFQMKKITELLQEKQQNHITFSYEVTADVRENEVDHVREDPLFYAVTWHSKSYQFDNLDIPPVRTAVFLKNKQKHVMAHLSCELLRKTYLLNLLNYFKKEGIRNFLCIMGENHSTDTSDFKSTNELITFIREITGSYFCIGVAGSPGADDNAMRRLKEKVDCGADFIVTQAFFEPSIYGEFLSKCKQFAINVPILPGIFVFETEKELRGFVNKIKLKVSDNFLELAKNEVSQNYTGTDVLSKLIKDISQQWNATHFHLFSLNKFANISLLLGKSKLM